MLNEKIIKAWYNPEVRGYEFYLEGKRLYATMNASVTIDDNWSEYKGGEFVGRANVSFLVNIVNEQPEWKSEQLLSAMERSHLINDKNA